MENAKKPLVGILMGSDSDLETMVHCAKMLERFEVPYEIRIVSAHRSPQKAGEYIRTVVDRGIEAVICAAGMAAHLAGVIAAETVIPVICVPLAGSSLAGLDALYSIVQMPPGIPVATMAIGIPGAKNAAIMAAEILAIKDPSLREKLLSHKKEMADEVETKDSLLQRIGYAEYLEKKRKKEI